MPVDPLDSIHFTKDFPDHVLLDIARNGAAQHDYRLFAVEILLARKSDKIKHPEIQDLVQELEIELDGIVFEHPAPSSGPLVASVTTETMFADGLVENGFTGFDFDLSPTKPAPLSPEPKEDPPDAPK